MNKTKTPLADELTISLNRVPRVFPTSLVVVGVMLIFAYSSDLLAQFPPRLYDIGWQLNFTESALNSATVPVIGTTFMLLGFWLGDSLRGKKNKGFQLFCYSLIVLLGLALFLLIPLYANNSTRLYKLEVSKIEEQREQIKPQEGSELAVRFESALDTSKQQYYTRVFRMSANGLFHGIALFFLSLAGIRYAREQADSGFECPMCKSGRITPANKSPLEASMSSVLRIHPFSCQDCQYRFNRFSLTGKPYRFFF